MRELRRAAPGRRIGDHLICNAQHRGKVFCTDRRCRCPARWGSGEWRDAAHAAPRRRQV